MTTLLHHVLKANIYIEPTLFVFIISTHIINIRILSSRDLRVLPCIYYFIGYSVSIIIYISLIAPTQILRALFIGWENTPVGCHIYFFVIFLGPYVARVMLVLASFDRYYCSSQPRPINSKKAKRKARKMILITTIFISIYLSPMCFIYYFDRKTGRCLQSKSLFVILYIVTQAIVTVTTTIAMITFGILTNINSRRYTLRIRQQKVHLVQRQLGRVLFLHMFVHIILTAPFNIIYFMNAFFTSTRTPNIIALRYLCVFLTQTDYLASFFLYILLGNFYRQRFYRLFSCFRHVNT